MEVGDEMSVQFKHKGAFSNSPELSTSCQARQSHNRVQREIPEAS